MTPVTLAISSLTVSVHERFLLMEVTVTLGKTSCERKGNGCPM